MDAQDNKTTQFLILSIIGGTEHNSGFKQKQHPGLDKQWRKSLEGKQSAVQSSLEVQQKMHRACTTNKRSETTKPEKRAGHGGVTQSCQR